MLDAREIWETPGLSHPRAMALRCLAQTRESRHGRVAQALGRLMVGLACLPWVMSQEGWHPERRYQPRCRGIFLRDPTNSEACRDAR